jgi:sigma-B regulation protein RsbU (phosphoserine phosphatase)
VVATIKQNAAYGLSGVATSPIHLYKEEQKNQNSGQTAIMKIPNESTLMDHLINHIKDNIYFKDRRGRFILINKEGAKRAGCSDPIELIGKTDMDIFTEEHSREAFADEQHIIQTGQPLYGKEEKETWEDGHETWVSTTKLPLRDSDGEIIGTFGISRDITEHKEAELRAREYVEENRRLCDEMQSDLQMAFELQKTFLPSSYPVFPEGVTPEESAARFCHYYESSGIVGGDFCSVRKLSDTETGVLLCDVSGHGVRSALITGLMRAIVEEISLKEKDPGKFLGHMNRVLKPIMEQGAQGLYSTACYIVLNVSNGTLQYANAGHPIPILLNTETGNPEWLADSPKLSGPPLATHLETTYETNGRQLNPRDAIIMYTDGIVEATNSAGEIFGKQRLMDFTNTHRHMLIRDLFPALVEEVRLFINKPTFDDDICLAGCRFDHCI